MEFEDLPIDDEQILRGKKPLPSEYNYLADKYAGTYRYIDPYKKNLETGKNVLDPHIKTMDTYKPMNPVDLEAHKNAAQLNRVFEINPSTGQLVPRKDIGQEDASIYFDIIKKKMKDTSVSVDRPYESQQGKIKEARGDRSYSQIELHYNPSTGRMEKTYSQSPEAKSMSQINNLEESYGELLDSYKEAGKEIPLEEKKKIQDRIINMYKAHSKKYWDNI